MRHHSNHQDNSHRYWVYVWKLCFGFECSTRWRSGYIATVGYGGQEGLLEFCLAVPRLFLHLNIETPFSWHRIRPRDGKYGESQAEFGLHTIGHDLLLRFGHDPYGTHCYHGGWFGGLRAAWHNREIALFRTRWIMGRRRYSREVLETDIPVMVDVGQWDEDRYIGLARRERIEWRQRFGRRWTRTDYIIEMTQGIPIPGKGENSWDCDDDAIYGFGAADLDGAIAHIVEQVRKERLRLGGHEWRPVGQEASR